MARRARRAQRDDLLPLVLALRRRRLERSGGRAFRAVLLAVILLAVAAAASAAVTAARVVRVALTDCTLAGRQPKTLPLTSRLYASTGHYLGAIRAPVYRLPVPYSSISKWLRRATVATEDRTFWTNDGLNYGSIVRAAVADLAAGKAVQGASTITQQLVRNMYLDDTKTLARKQEEACLALKLTKRWSKRRILTAYLDRVPYGNRALGVEAAAETYFGVPASRLGPAQAALIAGLPQAPTAYDPLAHPTAALERRNEVLHAMRATHALSPARYRRAIQRPLGLHPGDMFTRRLDPNFFSYVTAQLDAALGGEKAVRRDGLRVYTTLQPQAQNVAIRAMAHTLDRRGDPAAALVSLDPNTGAIRTLASSWHGHELQFDLPADGARQTGSAFKTFVLTAAVWWRHADPNRTWYDSAPFTYHGWSPHTYENRFFGPETLTKATLLSDNVVYAKLTLDLGPRNVARVAHYMGIHSPLQVVPSIGLGSNSVTPLMLDSAYATLASGGVWHQPYAIQKVVLSNGQVDPVFARPQPVRVLPKGVAWTVTQVLEANVAGGTGVAAQIPGRHVAGKTGTTTNWTDAWFAGYTPRRATVTWVGYPLHPRSMSDVHGIQVQGATFPTEIWHAYMATVLGHIRPLTFPRGPWKLQPYHGPRSMRGPHGRGKG